MSHTVDVDCNFSIRQNCATLYTTGIVYLRTNMTKLRPGHLNCGDYSEGHRGHDVHETPKKDVVGIKTARTCHVTIMVSHFCHNLKK